MQPRVELAGIMGARVYCVHALVRWADSYRCPKQYSCRLILLGFGDHGDDVSGINVRVLNWVIVVREEMTKN